MNAEEFYDAFKDALVFLGVAWGKKEQVQIEIKDDTLIMSYDNRTATLTTPKKVP